MNESRADPRLVWLAWVLGAIVFVLAITRADAHSWYPVECCHDRDCAPVKSSDVEEGPDGYFYRLTGEFIARKNTRVSMDEDFHLCRNEHTNLILCFFVPSRGA